MPPPSGFAILIGAGPTTGAGIARILSSPSQGNLAVALLSRTGDTNLADQISTSCHGGKGILRAFKTDTSEQSLSSTFSLIEKWKADLDQTHQTDLKLHLSIFNIRHSHKTPFEEENATRFSESLTVYATGAMIFSQLSLKWMLKQYPERQHQDDDPAAEKKKSNTSSPLQKRGTLIFTSTLGSLRTNPQYAAYGATRASVRMLAQSLAREYSARGVHVVHAIANGGITDKGSANADEASEDRQKVLRGERIQAESVGNLYLGLMRQGCDLWVHELDMRPAAEKF